MKAKPDRSSASRRPGWMWSRYWRSGRLETCLIDGAGAGAGFSLEGLWSEHFSGYPDGARLLDLATGNGQASFIAAATADRLGRRFDITGVDLAEVDPQARAQRLESRSSVRLVGGVALEALPFGAGGFDGVLSQFGFEYADRGKAAREAARVLRPGGRGRFVLHHADSAVTADTVARLAAHAQVLGGGAAVRRAERVYELHARSAPAAQLAPAEAQLREAVSQMRERLAAQGVYQDGRGAVEFFQDLARAPERYEPRDALRKLQDFQEEVTAWTLRQRAQVSSALDTEDMAALRGRLEQAGLTTGSPEIVRGRSGEVLAWRLDFAKPG